MIWTEITINTTTEAVEAITNIFIDQMVVELPMEVPKAFNFQRK
ncbi:hypothetical protein QUV80_11170 [Paraclostridium benzoelyticum]|nr:hypothetical protein [Paraclostridium benzoelyticum]